MNRECIYTHGECHYPNSKCSECPMLDYWCDEVEIAVDIAYEQGKKDAVETIMKIIENDCEGVSCGNCAFHSVPPLDCADAYVKAKIMEFKEGYRNDND